MSLAICDFIEMETENGRACVSNSLPFPKERGSLVKFELVYAAGSLVLLLLLKTKDNKLYYN